MQLLLRKITYDSAGVPEYVDSEVAGEEIVIGSSPHSDIQLLDSGVAEQHARLTTSRGQVRLLAEKGRSFVCNGKRQKQARLQLGDEIRIGAQIFTCSAAPSGFDLALEWQYVEMSGEALAEAYRTSLTQLGFSPRKASWLLGLAVLVLAGLGPLLSHFWQVDESAEGADSPGMALHTLWQSGPLLPAHQVAIGNDCTACHEKPFVQVEDSACKQCHSTVLDHALPDHAEKGHAEFVAALDEFACQNCHKEHNEPQSLVSRSDGLCLDCHQQMNPAVSGFSQDTHPVFALSLLQPDVERQNGRLAVDWQHEEVRPQTSDGSVSQTAPPMEEVNHLNYPHDIHLDPEAVKHSRRGDALQCADCHTLSSDREHFEPIRMEKHCASCHELSFDPRNPQKQLPHGSPEGVYEALEAHFIGRAFSPEPLGGFERRRLPGKDRDEEDCDQDYDCAKEQALREAERQFTQRGCVTCHEVSESEGAEGGERWEVLPVKINHDWYADARFDHQSHLTQSDRSGDALCLSCHEADTSSASSDILMPGIATCSSCHDDQERGGRVALDCISCHDYHKHKKTSRSGGIRELMEGAKHGEL